MSHSSTITESFADKFERLKAAVQAGKVQRCAACLSWVSGRKVGALAAYFPPEDTAQEPVPYVVCKRCMARADTKEKQRAMSQRAEAYVMGEQSK